LWNKVYQNFGKIYQPVEYSYEQSVNHESFLVLAFEADEATLRHLHVQGPNTTKS